MFKKAMNIEMFLRKLPSHLSNYGSNKLFCQYVAKIILTRIGRKDFHEY